MARKIMNEAERSAYLAERPKIALRSLYRLPRSFDELRSKGSLIKRRKPISREKALANT